MSEVTAQLVKELRDQTGAGIGDCKKALEESAGDITQATDWLRKKTNLKPARVGRVASEGIVEAYIHMGGKIGVLVEVNCETDFAAKSAGFHHLVRDIALHIAASAPTYVRREEVDTTVLDREKDVLKAQLREQGKPEAMLDKILVGKVEKFYKEVCLLEQPFVKDNEKTVQQFVNEEAARIGETVNVRRFTRYLLGDGLAKKSTDFAAEVAATVAGTK